MIVLNGEPQDYGAGEVVARVLERMGLTADARGVAVAIDGEVVPRASWRSLEVREGARVEVLTAMQGG